MISLGPENDVFLHREESTPNVREEWSKRQGNVERDAHVVRGLHPSENAMEKWRKVLL